MEEKTKKITREEYKARWAYSELASDSNFSDDYPKGPETKRVREKAHYAAPAEAICVVPIKTASHGLLLEEDQKPGWGRPQRRSLTPSRVGAQRSGRSTTAPDWGSSPMME